MGCSQSTQADVQASRQRQPTNAPPRTTAPAALNSPSKAQSTPVKGGDGGGAATEPGYSQSYSDQRLLEQDFFKQIITKTSNNLIDVSQNISTAAAVDKGKQYTEKFKTIRLPNPHLASGASDATNIVAILSAPTLTSENKDLVQKQAEALAGALSAMQIKNVGDLVVHLPEL